MRLGGLIATALLCLQLTACAPPEPIRIGYLGALSGRATDLGISGLNGVHLAIDERNATGGIKGRPIELIEEDDRQDPEAGRRAFQKLATKGVVAVIGPMTSVIAQTIVSQANERQLPLISPTVTTAQLSGRDDYFLRIIPSTSIFASATARHLVEQQGARRIRPVIDLANASFSKSWLRDFSAALSASGGTLLEPIPLIADSATDFDALARRALAEQPDSIVLITGALDTAMLCEGIRRRHQTITLAAAEWAGTERLLEIGGRAIEGLFVAQSFERAHPAPAYRQFRAAYLKIYGHEPGFAGTNAYDATRIVLDLLAEGTPPHELKRAILARKEFPGRQRRIVLDANGDSDGEVAMKVVRYGAYVGVAP